MARERLDKRCGGWTRSIVAFAVGIIIASVEHAYPTGQKSAPCGGRNLSRDTLPLRGLYEPRIIFGRLMVRAVLNAPRATVIFFIDGEEVSRVSEAPYDLSVEVGGSSRFVLGSHVLSACAITEQGTQLWSEATPFTTVADMNHDYSANLSPYAPHQSALAHNMDSLLQSTATPGAAMSDEELRARRLAFGMYLNIGIDPSLDAGHDQSEVLAAHIPLRASTHRPHRDSLPLSMWFSRDAVFYHAIPHQWPRVPLPKGYIQKVQFSTAYYGDGIGFGQVIASSSDPLIRINSQWHDVRSTFRTFDFRMPVDWSSRLPTNQEGDSHLIFIDPLSNTFVSSYKTSIDFSTGGPKALYASSPHLLDGLGGSGGSIAAGFAELPLLVQKGEATNPREEIPHAIGGAVSRVWAARVYPAISRDAEVLTSVNPCTSRGFTNTGVVPYGGIIQLDPDLQLAKTTLSLPAYRILRAMQVYGYYVMDFGCADLDIYTAMDAEDLEPYGGVWGNANGRGIQNEIQSTIESSRLFIVPPPIKR